MVVIAIIAVLALVTLVAAYMGSKFWHWAHVLVVVALFFATVGFTFLAAEVLDVRTRFQKKAEQATKQLKPQEELNSVVVRGTSDRGLINRMIGAELAIDEAASEEPAYRAPGLVDLRHNLRLQNARLGRIWRDAQPQGAMDPQTGRLSVAIEFPQPLGIAEGAILFAFEQGAANSRDPQQGRQYLGEFRVVSINGQQMMIEPVLSLDDYEADRLAQSRGPWSFYETMPQDRHEVYEGFAADQLRQLLPEGSVEEYLRHGTPWTVDDGEWTKEGRDLNGDIVGPDDWDSETKFVYRRPLRDFAFLFNDFAKRRIEMEAQILALEEDLVKLKVALETAERVGESLKDVRGKLKADLAGLEGDQQAITAHLAAVTNQAERGQALLDRVLASNDRLATQLTSAQQAAAGVGDFRQQPVPSQGAVDIDAL